MPKLSLPNLTPPMEQHQNHYPNENSTTDNRSRVDTSRPFRSIKEATVIFDEQSSIIHTYSPTPFSLPKNETPIFSQSLELESEPSWKHSCCSHDTTLVDTVKKLEAELDRTKEQVKVLKRKGYETEVALASLNAELHRRMSKLAWAEAAKAAMAASGVGAAKEEKKKDLIIGKTKSCPLPSLAQVLSVDEKESLSIERTKKRKWMKKKKPIIPLFADLFISSKAKGSTNTLENPLHAVSPLQWN
ncbi:hypothetical protein CASFOL_004548 [Castilleja foliolosa]|uniref:Uncharacterized protein n=1 Tax=Castilleja foliolosa TaxID=1961234 RepID=A0ABD3EAV7_9LAMI